MISHEEKSKAMNNFTHKLYLLIGNDAQYHKLIKQRNLSDLSITENRSEASILLTAPPLAAPCLEDFPNLKWIQSIYAGVDALVPHLDHFSGKLTNVRGIFGQQISEYVLGYLIEYFRQFVQYRDCQQNETWQPRPYQTLSEKNGCTWDWFDRKPPGNNGQPILYHFYRYQSQRYPRKEFTILPYFPYPRVGDSIKTSRHLG